MEEPNLTEEELERIKERIPWFFYVLREYIEIYEQDIQEIIQYHGKDSHWIPFRNGQQNAYKEAWSLLFGY